MSTTSVQSTLSDEKDNSTLTDANIYFDKCPRCLYFYDFLRRSHGLSRLPLILKCKHTLCEDCIQKLVSFSAVSCPICNESSKIPRKHQNKLSEYFSPHYALMGYLVGTRSVNKVDMAWRSDKLDTNQPKPENRANRAQSQLTISFPRCDEHPDSFVNIKCETCDLTLCSYCFLEQHTGHTVKYLYKLLPEEMAEFESLKRQAKYVLQMLQISQKTVEKLKKCDIQYVERDIRNYFSNLHAKLHFAEQNIREKLATMQIEGVDADLVSISETIDKDVSHIQQTLRICDNGNNQNLNIRSLYDQLLKFKDMPCQFSVQGGSAPVSFMPTLDLDDIEHHFSIETSPDINYTFTPIESWNNIVLPEYKMPSPAPSVSHAPQQHINQKKTPETNNNQKLLSTSPSTLSMNDNGKVIWHKVVITHLNSLNSFFVQKCAVFPALKEFNKTLQRRIPKEVLSIVLGEFYIVSYKIKNNHYWRRGKVIDIIPNDDDTLYKIFFLDYGNIQILPQDRLKYLDPHARKREPFAIECKLTNPNGVLFEENSHLRVLQMIAGQDLVLKVEKKDPGQPYEVDLMVRKSNGATVSIRELLSVNDSISQLPEIEVSNLEKKLFKNSHNFPIGQIDDVVVSFVRDPSFISVQLHKNQGRLIKMKSELSNYYTKASPCIPMENTDVVVNFAHSIHGNYHRATILQVNPNDRIANVFFVDWGGYATVSWSAINILSENFIRIECQAIIVSLADIEPFNPRFPWPKETIEFVNNFTAGGHLLKMVVNQTNPLEVILFNATQGGDICLNALLVDHSLAISTGEASKTVMWPSTDNETSVKAEVEEEEADFATQMIRKSEALLLTRSDPHPELKEYLKRQIEVVNCQSPSLIYIKFTKYNDKFDELHKNLQIHYQQASERVTKKKWKMMENCVVYDKKKNQYFRACIKSKSDTELTAYLYDHVRDLKVRKEQIFVQHEYFENFGCFVYKCSLAYIKPAGGDSGKWTATAIEMLQKIIKTHTDLHIKKCESPENSNILSVVIYYTYTSVGNALESPKIKLISINKCLVESGLALSTAPTSYAEINDETPPASAKYHDDSVQHVIKKEIHSKKAWLDIMPIEKRDFEANLLCFDSMGVLSVRDDDLQSTYFDLEKGLNMALNSSNPNPSSNWHIGEMCSIIDNNVWYRGIVIDMFDVHLTVEMIDFGSAHTVKLEDVCKSIMYTEVPPLLHKIRLFDITPKNGEWTGNHVNSLLSVVSDRVKIKIVDDFDELIPSAEVYLENGENLNELSLTLCPDLMRYRIGVEQQFEMEVVVDVDAAVANSIEKEEKVEPERSSYIYTFLESLPTNQCQKLMLLNAVSHNQIVLSYGAQQMIIGTDNLPIAKSIFDEIQEKSEKQPHLTRFKINQPCVAFHKKTKTWCRALLHTIDGFEFGFTNVFMVDYGIFDICKVSNLRVINSNWLKCPASNIIAKLNVELVQQDKTEVVMNMLNQLCDEIVDVLILATKPLVVHLYKEETLCYENLIEKGVLKLGKVKGILKKRS